MAVQLSPGGLIVVLKGNVIGSLRRIAKAHSMLVLEGDAADQAFEVVRCQQPPVVIVQVGGAINEMLKFIRLVTTAARPVPLIAVATRHSARIEQAVLREGARYYLPGVRRNVVERLVEAVTRQNRWIKGGTAGRVETRHRHTPNASFGTR